MLPNSALRRLPSGLLVPERAWLDEMERMGIPRRVAIANSIKATLPDGTAVSGDAVATHTASAKEYQVVMVADESGHLQQTLPTYNLWIQGQAVGANKLHWDIFNPAASGGVIEIRGIWVIPKSDVAVTGALGVEMGLYRTSAAGTGGTAAGYNTGTALTAPVFSLFDQNNTALSSSLVTARAAPTGGATIASPYWGQYIPVEETRAEAYLAAFTNLLPTGMFAQRMTLREGQGLLCKQGSVAGAGTLAALVHFTRT